MGEGIRKKSMFRLFYKYGEVEVLEMDQTDNERNRLEQILVNYFATGDHCSKSTPVCRLRYSDTARYSKNKSEHTKDINFNNLVAVTIVDVDFDNYNDNGGTCDLGNGKFGNDYNCLIKFSFPRVSEKSLHKIDQERFMGAWSHKSGEDISSLHAAWRNHKTYPSSNQKLKWIVRSECFASTTTLYIVDFDIIHSIEAIYKYDYSNKQIHQPKNLFPEK